MNEALHFFPDAGVIGYMLHSYLLHEGASDGVLCEGVMVCCVKEPCDGVRVCCGA